MTHVSTSSKSATTRRRVRSNSYISPIEHRAAAAAAMIKDGWGARAASSLFCVNRNYVDIVRKLSDADRQRLYRGELKLADLHQDHLRQLAERRAERLAAAREAQAQAKAHAKAEARTRAVDSVLETVELDRVIERILCRFGPTQLLEAIESALQDTGCDLAQLVVDVSGSDRLMRALDVATAPQRVTAPNGNGAHA
jgi:hypothetical protein